ncbi:MAG: hypothetical protein ACM359_19925, partial [Bacillota bacterium]
MHRIESLEPRQLLSGNVTAWISGASLHVLGDRADNQLVLASDPTSRGGMVLSGNGTTINGQGNAFPLTNAVRDVRIYLGDGDDSIEISNVNLSRNLMIFANNGADQVVLNTVQVNGNLTIDTAQDNDTVDLVQTTVNGRTTVNTGADTDIFTADGSTFRRLFLLNVGSGDDQIFTQSVNFFGGKVITPTYGKNRTRARVVTQHYDFRKGD